MKKLLLIIACGIISLQKGYSSGDSLTIIDNNRSFAVIVLPQKPSAAIETAAEKFQKLIFQSTGVTLDLTNVASKEKINIHIGKTGFISQLKLNLTGLDEDGFLFDAIDDKNFVIVGGSDWGTEFGMYSFLTRFLGIEALFPGKLGMYVPKQNRVRILKQKTISNPAFISRQISPINIQNASDLGLWGRFNGLRGRIEMKHNLLNLFPPDEYYNKNPDFYPDSKDPRKVKKPNNWQPNFSAPGIADSAAQKIIRYFKNNPGSSSYSLGINDSRNYDQTESSLSRRSGKKNYLGQEDVSDDYFLWANNVIEKVGKVFPDKKFGVLAYNAIAEPPSQKIGVSSQIVPFLTYERLRWVDPKLRDQGHRLTEAWGKQATALGFYDYTYGLNYLLPRLWFHEMQDYLIWGSEHKVKYYYAELYPNWGEGPKAWVQSKLLWNPHYNVDSLLNVWYVKTGGTKAAPFLSRYYSIWEQFWTVDVFNSEWVSVKGQHLPFLNFGYLNLVPKQYLDSSDTLLKAALYNASGEEKQRITELMKMWELYKLAAITYQGPGGSAKEKLRAVKNSVALKELLLKLGRDPLYSPAVRSINKYLNLSN